MIFYWRTDFSIGVFFPVPSSQLVIVYRINVRFKLLNFTIYIFTFFSLHYSGAFIIPGFWIFFSVSLSNILEAWFYFPLSPPSGMSLIRYNIYPCHFFFQSIRTNLSFYENCKECITYQFENLHVRCVYWIKICGTNSISFSSIRFSSVVACSNSVLIYYLYWILCRKVRGVFYQVIIR